MRKSVIATLVYAVIGISSHTAHAGTCEQVVFVKHPYSVCRFEPAAEIKSLRVFWLDDSGAAFGDMPTLQSWLSTRGQTLNFAMNAGIFESVTIPTGLLVVDKKERHALNRDDGRGNFFAKPNGVFWTQDGEAHIDATEAYRAKGASPDLATQSGPMLVIGGELAEGIDAFGPLAYLRNGVCVRASGQAVFAISNVKVTMGEFGRFFKEGLGCAHALFLDGCRSILFSSELRRNDVGTCESEGKRFKAGPLIGRVSPSTPSTNRDKK